MKRMAVLMLLVTGVFLFAQEEAGSPWKNGGQGALNFSQTALSNWSGGGLNALSLNGFLSYFVNYQHENLSWDNTLEIAYGTVNQGGSVQKTDDKIDLASKFGYHAFGAWNYSGLFSFKTQMTPGYADTVLISSLMAPAYMQISAGMEYKPSDDISLLISPLSGKFTFLLNDDLSSQGLYGVDSAKTTRAELGAYAKVQFRKEIFENVVFQTKCDMFMNYIENTRFIDVSWDVLLAMKINEFLSASISTQMVYDQDYNAKLQFKETLGIGLSFSF